MTPGTLLVGPEIDAVANGGGLARLSLFCPLDGKRAPRPMERRPGAKRPWLISHREMTSSRKRPRQRGGDVFAPPEAGTEARPPAAAGWGARGKWTKAPPVDFADLRRAATERRSAGDREGAPAAAAPARVVAAQPPPPEPAPAGVAAIETAGAPKEEEAAAARPASPASASEVSDGAGERLEASVRVRLAVLGLVLEAYELEQGAYAAAAEADPALFDDAAVSGTVYEVSDSSADGGRAPASPVSSSGASLSSWSAAPDPERPPSRRATTKKKRGAHDAGKKGSAPAAAPPKADAGAPPPRRPPSGETTDSSEGEFEIQSSSTSMMPPAAAVVKGGSKRARPCASAAARARPVSRAAKPITPDASPPDSPKRAVAPAAAPRPSVAAARDADDGGWQQFPRRSARHAVEKRKLAGVRPCEFRGVSSYGGWWWASCAGVVRSFEVKRDAARAYDMMVRDAGIAAAPNFPNDAAQKAFEAKLRRQAQAPRHEAIKQRHR